MYAEDYEKLIPRMIEAGTPESLEDALKLCKAYEKTEATVVLDSGTEEDDYGSGDTLFDQGCFDQAHAWARQIRTRASQMAKSGYGKRMLDLYYACHLFDAPYWFDSFCIYIERNRAQEKQFYLPRRKQLLPITEALQDMEDGKLDLLGISMPPGTGKTTLAEFFLAWQCGKHPELPNLIGSHNNSFLNGVYGEMLRIMDRRGEYLWGEVFPTMKVINTSARSMMIDVGRDRRDGKRFMTLEFSSIGSGNAGKVRAMNLLYCDDLVDSIETAMSRDRLDKLWQQYYTDLRQRKVGSRCRELHISTRWSLHDILGRLEREYEGDERARFIKFPALDENDESNFDYPFGLGYTTEMLHMQRDIMDDASWRALYQNEPIERMGRLFDPEELRRYSTLPEQEPDNILAVCDTKEQGDDYAVMPIVYQYGADYYVEDFVCYNGKVETIEDMVVDKLLKHNVKVCRVESNRGGMIFAENIAKRIREAGGNTNIQTKWTQTNKETRIITGSVWVKQRCLFKYESDYKANHEYRDAMNLLYGYSMAGKNKHDDAPDAMAMLADFCQSFGSQKAEVIRRFW